jgi:hypothetical protein
MTGGLLDRFRSTPSKSGRVFVVATIAVVVFSFGLFGLLGIRINTSPSLPPGFYVMGMNAKLDLIEFCPAEPFASLAITRV